MKAITGAVLTAVLLAATPALADRGGHGHRGHQHWKHDRQVHHHYGAPRHVVKHVYYTPRVVRHYYQPARVYYAPPAPAFGVHISLPGIYIPIR